MISISPISNKKSPLKENLPETSPFKYTPNKLQNSLNQFAHAQAIKYNMLTAKPQAGNNAMLKCKSSLFNDDQSIFKEKQGYVDQEDPKTAN